MLQASPPQPKDEVLGRIVVAGEWHRQLLTQQVALRLVSLCWHGRILVKDFLEPSLYATHANQGNHNLSFYAD